MIVKDYRKPPFQYTLNNLDENEIRSRLIKYSPNLDNFEIQDIILKIKFIVKDYNESELAYSIYEDEHYLFEENYNTNYKSFLNLTGITAFCNPVVIDQIFNSLSNIHGIIKIIKKE